MVPSSSWTASVCFPLDESWTQAFSRPSKVARCLSPPMFCGARVALAVFWLAVFIWSVVDHTATAHEADVAWLIYLTNWTLLFELVYLVLAATLTCVARYPNNHSLVVVAKGEQTPWFARLAYAMQSVTYIASFFVFILYWVLVYDGSGTSALSIVTHGVNFLVAFVDFLIAGLPFKLVHVWAPLVYGLSYIVFSLMYDLAGGTSEGDPYIYEVLDWSVNPSRASAIGLGVVFVAFPLLFSIFWGVCFPLRSKCNCCPPENAAYKAGKSRVHEQTAAPRRAELAAPSVNNETGDIEIIRA